MWTFDPFAFVSAWCFAIVKTIKPKRAGICSKCPLTDNDRVLDLLGFLCLCCPCITDILNRWFRRIPCLVNVSVKDDIVDVVIFKKVIPDFSAVSEGIMEDELEAWLFNAH